jgi:pyruvate dehydrogenase E2 component (dihydrolipoamide acetyltransferase)
MTTDIIIPDVGATGGDVRILAWLVRIGDFVSAGTPIVTIETDKATEDIEAFSDGYVETIAAAAGSDVPVGSVIATLRTKQGNVEPKADGHNGAGAHAGFTTCEQVAPPSTVGLRNRSVRLAPGLVLASPAARRLAREKNIDLASLSIGRDGRPIHLTQVQHAIAASTAKSANTGTPPTVFCELGPNEPAPPRSAQFPTADAPTAVTRKNQNDTNRDSSPPDRLRRVIAERVSQSKSEIPHFYMSLTVDMTEANRARAWLQQASERSPVVTPTINDLIVRAAALALCENPKLNAVYRKDGVENLSSIDVGIVVGTEDGVVIPIVPGVDQLDLYELAETTRSLKQSAREGTLTAGQMRGGALSVSNLGMYGAEQFTAIIDPVQSSILACGAVQRRPAVQGDQVVVRELMTVTLSVDHRAADGVAAAKFLSAFQRYLEIPQLLITGNGSHDR